MIFNNKKHRRNHQVEEENVYIDKRNSFLDNLDVLSLAKYEPVELIYLSGDYESDIVFTDENKVDFRFSDTDFDFIVDEYMGYYNRDNQYVKFMDSDPESSQFVKKHLEERRDFSTFKFRDASYIIGKFHMSEGYNSSIVFINNRMIFKSYIEIVEPILTDVFIGRYRSDDGKSYLYGIFCSTTEVVIPFKYKMIKLLNIRYQSYPSNPLDIHSAYLSFDESLCILAMQDSDTNEWSIIDSNLAIYTENLFNVTFLERERRIVACKKANFKEDGNVVCVFDYDGVLLSTYTGISYMLYNHYLIIETGKGCLLANIIGGSVIFEADKYQTVNFVDQDLFENITSEPKFLILQKNEKYGLFDVFLDCVLDFEYSMIKPVRSTRNYTVVFELVKNGKKQLQEIEVNEGIFDF